MSKWVKFIAIIFLLTAGLVPVHAVHAATNSSAMTVGASSLNVRSTPSRSAHVIASLKRGTKVQAFNSRYGWTYVQANRVKGWVASSYLLKGTASSGVHSQSSTGKSGVVTVSGLRLRKTPSLSGRIIKTLGKGTRVTIAKKQSGWVNVKTSTGAAGWVSQSYVKMIMAQQLNLPFPAHQTV